MKSRIFILALAAFSFTAFQANAQVDVTVNPVGLLFANLSVSGDFILSDDFSVEASLGYGSGNELNDTYKWSNIPLTVTGKYYFNPDDGADKFYGDVFIRFVNRSYKVEDGGSSFSDYKQTRLGAGVGIGYKSISRSGVVFDIGFGVGRAFVDNISDDGENVNIDWPDIMFTGKLGVGYRFGS